MNIGKWILRDEYKQDIFDGPIKGKAPNKETATTAEQNDEETDKTGH